MVPGYVSGPSSGSLGEGLFGRGWWPEIAEDAVAFQDEGLRDRAGLTVGVASGLPPPLKI